MIKACMLAHYIIAKYVVLIKIRTLVIKKKFSSTSHVNLSFSILPALALALEERRQQQIKRADDDGLILHGVVGAPHHGLGQVLEVAGFHLGAMLLHGDVVPDEAGHELR